MQESMHKSFLSQMDTDKAEEVWGHRGQALRGRWEGPNEEIGAYHREGPPLSSLLCSLPGSRTMQGVQYIFLPGQIKYIKNRLSAQILSE